MIKYRQQRKDAKFKAKAFLLRLLLHLILTFKERQWLRGPGHLRKFPGIFISKT